MSNQPKNTSSNEVDIIQLFNYFSNGIKSFFTAIGKLFLSLGKLIMMLLLFVQKHFIKFVLVLIVGFIAGWFIDSKKTVQYSGAMVVEPNYDSTEELYNQIHYFNTLAINKDSVLLANELAITTKEAKAILRISIEDYIDRNEKVNLFDEFVRTLDTTAQRSISFEEYEKNFNPLNATFHKISIITTNPFIPNKIENSLVKSINENPYFDTKFITENKILDFQDTLLKNQIQTIDSFQKAYRISMLEAASNPSNPSTNINLSSGNKSEDKEESLLRLEDEIKVKLIDVIEAKGRMKEPINIVSSFPKKVSKTQELTRKFVFFIPLILITITLLVFVLIEINKGLKRYKELNHSK